jgi:hypothetical protein
LASQQSAKGSTVDPTVKTAIASPTNAAVNPFLEVPAAVHEQRDCLNETILAGF